MSKGKALIYCRISSPAQRVGNSLNFQETACLACAEQLGYKVHQVIKEVYSGAKLFERAKLSEARTLIRSGEFRALIAYKVDRLSRDSAHLMILSEECERFGCALIFVEAGPSITRADEARAAEIERRNLGERVALARRTMLRQGRPVLTGWHLYGYRPN